MVKISRDIAMISKGKATPETYKEFYDLWMNTYKDTFSRMFDPQTMKPSKEILDSLKESTGHKPQPVQILDGGA